MHFRASGIKRTFSMKFKKLSLIIISFILAVCMALPLAACEDNGTSNSNPDSGTTNPDDGNGESGDNTPTDPVQLVAPQISLNQSTGVITWFAVEHANYYEVYEGEKVVAKQTATSYTITKTAVGSYTYAVKAFSVSEAYTASEYSNAVTYVVKPEGVEPLSAPVITLKDNKITWTAIENATAYEIYEDGEKLTQVTDTEFNIERTLAGVYIYKVRAISDDTVHFEPSEFSNSVTYSVSVRAVGFKVTVTVPSGYPALVQVALYKDGETTPVATKAVSFTGTRGSVEFFNSNEYNYRASIVFVAKGYMATSVRLSASNNEGEIMIISLGGSEMLKVGTNTFKVNNIDQTGADQIYYFMPEKDGMYTLDASLESKDMYISVDRSLYIDTAGDLNIASFRAEAGVPVEITVVGFEIGTFSFKVVEGELEQSLKIGIGWGNRANYIFGDCTRTLEIANPDYYVFEFGFAGLGGRMITLTIDGKDYVFGRYDEETTDVENWLVIPLNKGTHEVTITTVGFNSDNEFGYCVLCIYQGEELRSAN